MVSPNPFTLELLQAINDWQRRSNSKRGDVLSKLCINLPKRYKGNNKSFYRKINLKKDGVFSLFGRYRLSEKISSWTTSVKVAKGFKHGVSMRHLIEQSIILSVVPKSHQVVIDLNEVYHSSDFKSAVQRFESKIIGFDKGIGKYGNSQCEVILELEFVSHHDVYMLGGRSSGFPVFHANVLKRKPNVELLYDMGANKVYAFKWLSNSATRRLIKGVTRRNQYPYNVFNDRFGI